MNPDRAAATLAALWKSGEQVAALPPDQRPATLAEGYDIQDRLAPLLGEGVAGWKLGVGSRKQRVATGIGASVAGRVYASRCFRGGDIVPLPGSAPVTVEFEIAYVLGRDLRPEDDLAEPMEAVAQTRVTFELVRARFTDRSAVGWPSFAADNAGFEALVVGEPVEPASVAALADSLVVSVDGEERARALTGDDITDPDIAFRDFVSLARARRMLLPAGAIISTGTVSRPFAIAGAVDIVARHAGGELTCRTTIRD